jgi:YkoP domain
MRFLVRNLDALIRKANRVFEFNLEAGCILRLQVSRAARPVYLPDLAVAAGEPVLLIHLWNERLPRIPAAGVDLAWAKRLLRLFRHSLCLAAAYLQENRQLDPIRAVSGVTILARSGLHETGSRFMQDMGFTVIPYSSPLGRFGEFWENFYSWLIIWTFNPGSLPARPLIHLRRSEMLMSREAFIQRYGRAQFTNRSGDRLQ